MSGGDRYLQWREGLESCFEKSLFPPDLLAPKEAVWLWDTTSQGMFNDEYCLTSSKLSGGGSFISSERSRGSGGVSVEKAWNHSIQKSLLPTSSPAGFWWQECWFRNCLVDFVINGGRRMFTRGFWWYETPISGHDDEYCHHSSKLLGGYRYRWVGWGSLDWCTKVSFPDLHMYSHMRPPASSHCLYRYQKWQGRGWGEQVWTPKPLFPACLPAAFGEKRAVVKGICERTPNLEPSRWNIVTILRNCLVKLVVSNRRQSRRGVGWRDGMMHLKKSLFPTCSSVCNPQVMAMEY